MSTPNLRGCWTWCDAHGKRAFIARRIARQNIRAQHTAMRAYRCTDGPGWHIGHLPWAVKRGDLTAAEAYGEAS